MRRSQPVFAFLSLALLLAGAAACTSKIVAVPATNALSPGYSMKLMTHALKVSFNYGIYSRTNPGGGTSLVAKVEALKLTLVALPNDRFAFVIDPKNFRPANVAVTKASVQSTNRGMVSSVNLDVQDKTGETIQAVAKTAVTLAAFAAVAGAEIKTATYKLVDTVAYDLLVTPEGSRFVKTDLGYVQTQQVTYDPPAQYHGLNTPPVTLTFLAATPPNEPDFGKEPIKGVPYLQPLEVLVTATVDKQNVAQDMFPFAQLGQPRFLDASNRFFSNANTSIIFDPATGLPTKYEYSGTSAAEDMATTASALATQITTGLSGAKTSADAAAITEMENAKKALEARTNMVKAASDLIDAQRTLQAKQNP